MWSETLGRVNVLVLVAAPLLQAGVRATLSAVTRFNVLAERQATFEGSVQVVVTDLTVGARPTLDDGGPDVASLPPHAKVLAICPHAREHSIETALRSGVHGFVRANCAAGELIDAVQTLAAGALYVCPEVAQRMAAAFSRDALTIREEEVLRLLARGQCNKTIARELGIAVGTVKTHIKGIMTKLDASSRTEAACIAAEKGIVDVPEFRSRRAWSPIGLAASRERADVAAREELLTA